MTAKDKAALKGQSNVTFPSATGNILASNHRTFNNDSIDSFINTEETTTQTVSGDIDLQNNELLNAANLFNKNVLLFSNDGTLTGMTTTNDTDNVWISGTVDSIEGANSLYISNNGVNAQYDSSIANISHIETNTFIVPSDAVNVWVKLPAWECEGEQGELTNQFDFGRCFIALSAFSPTAGVRIVDGADVDHIGIIKYVDTPEVREAYMYLNEADLAKYRGATCKIVVSWENDSIVGTNPGLNIGSIEVWAGDSLHNERSYLEATLTQVSFALTGGFEVRVDYETTLDDRNQNWDLLNHKFIASENGIHKIDAGLTISTAGTSVTQCRIYKNGVQTATGSDTTPAAAQINPSRSTSLNLVVGDEIEIRAFSSSNGTLLSNGPTTLTIIGPINKG